MPFSSPSYTPRGDTNNDRLNTLTSHSSKDEYDRIYTRDSETYADCAYDSGHQDHCESEEDSDEDNNNYISFALPLSQWTKSKRRSRAFGLKTYKGEHVEIEVIQPLIESPNLPELPDEVFELVCTYLSRATLRYSVNLVLYLTHGYNEDKNEATAIVVDDSPKMFPERYQLQRFCVNDICTDLKVLERLLVTCPNLRVFNAKDIEVGLTRPQEGSDINEEEVRAAIIAEERRARQRLIDLAAKHCPKLEWYSFHIPSVGLDKEDLRDKARSFPDLKMQSVSLTGYLDAVFDDALSLRGLLEDISVLELHSTDLRDEVDALHRILCLTPNLLHLIAPNAYLNTSNLWKPPASVVKFTKRRVFTTVGNRKRHHRNVRRRRAREQALTDPRSTAPAADIGTSVAIIDPLIPVTWQVHSLKTLELSLHHSSSLVDFADYIFRYRLFRNLVILALKIWDLKVGQRQSLRKVSAAAPAAETLIEPVRYPNELLGLRSLRCLEECTLRAENVPGMISVKNFKFLKRTESFKTVSFLPFSMNGIKWKETRGHRNNKSVLETMTAINDDDDDDDDDEDDEKAVDNGEEEKEEDKKGLRDETFWPKLSTFHISYRNISTGTDTRKLVRRLQHLRPGVAFSIQSHTSFW
ncbi:hypothetical protein BGZ91_005233 [Linnemannia elongata]|nr:hypothetical protein BGZ91_005233 [Linnemannia elongata]